MGSWKSRFSFLSFLFVNYYTACHFFRKRWFSSNRYFSTEIFDRKPSQATTYMRKSRVKNRSARAAIVGSWPMTTRPCRSSKAVDNSWKRAEEHEDRFCRLEKWWPPCFGDSEGIRSVGYGEKDNTITGAHYGLFLNRLKDHLKEKRSRLVRTKSALSSGRRAVPQINCRNGEIARNGVFKLVLPPHCSPNSTPCDFLMFPVRKLQK